MGIPDTRIILDRKSDIYQDIESCKTSYELRYVVAYEAAIRNEEARKLIEEYIKSRDKEKLSILENDFGITECVVFYYLIRNYNRILRQKSPSSTASRKGAIGLGNIQPPQRQKTGQRHKLFSIYKPDGSNGIILNNTAIVMNSDGIQRASLEDIEIFQSLCLELDFKRPKLEPNPSKNLPINPTKKFYIELNFELPESELKEYVEELSRLYSTGNIPGLSELLTDDENAVASSGETRVNQKRYADMFYLYDHYKMSRELFPSDEKTYEKIALDLAYSRGDDKELQTTTMRNYHKAMIDLIDKKGYFPIITGLRDPTENSDR